MITIQGCSLLNMWVKRRLGPKWAFRLLIWWSLECDSKTLRTVILFVSMMHIIIFHLLHVAGLFAPFTLGSVQYEETGFFLPFLNSKIGSSFLFLQLVSITPGKETKRNRN